MNEDELEELGEELEDLEEIEEIADIGDDKMLGRIGNKLLDKAFDKLLGIPSKEELRHQKRLEKEELRRQREEEKLQHARAMHELEIQKLKGDIEKAKNNPMEVQHPETPQVLYGELPSVPQAPNLMCETNPDEFKAFLDYIARNPCSIVILGSKGYGKSALGHALLEYLHSVTGRRAVLYAPLTLKKSILPTWLLIVDSWDNIPDNALVLVDEAALMLNSRNPGSRSNRSFTELNAISRQKNLGLIFGLHPKKWTGS